MLYVLQKCFNAFKIHKVIVFNEFNFIIELAKHSCLIFLKTLYKPENFFVSINIYAISTIMYFKKRLNT